MPASRCPDPDELAAFADGRLAGAALDTLADHLSDCPDCQRRLEGLDTPVNSVLAALRQPGPGPTPTRPDRPPATDAEGAGRGPGAGLPERVGGYAIRGELGRGGMGVVYEAWQEPLRRAVALKMMLGSRFADPRQRTRFRAEAEAVARLQHPNIVQIHEVGEHEGLPFFTLELVGGGSLAARLRGRPQPPRQAAEWLEVLARAVQHAHGHGVVHRDLKPANVLLTADGALKVADFGLAKPIEGVPAQTASGMIVGTPEYMAPEQAAGRGDVGPAADVWALGAILYELLTGRPPFRAASPLETLDLVRAADPVAPHRLNPAVPRDLETVCLKCLEKEPARRYASAGDLADDVRRFLDGRPVRARPVGTPERAWKWARRRPALAALLLVTGLVVFPGFPGATWLWREAELARRSADRSAAAEAAARGDAEYALYLSRIALVDRRLEANDLAGAEELLRQCHPREGRPDLRGWEWRHLTQLGRAELATLGPHPNWTWSPAFSPDGRRLVVAVGTPGFATQDDRTTPGQAAVWELTTGRRLATLEGHAASVQAAALTPDGRRLVVGDVTGVVRLWDAERWTEQAVLPGAGPVRFLRCAPDGRLLAIASQAKGVSVWDLTTRRERAVLRGAEGRCAPAFSPDARLLAARTAEGIGLYAADTGELLRTLPGRPGEQQCLAFSPDGRRLAAATAGGPIQVWDVDTGREVLDCRGHTAVATDVAFSPDGAWLASASSDKTVRLWDARTGRERSVYRGHRGGVQAVAFSPDGRRLASTGADRVVRVWDVTRDPRGRLLGQAPANEGVAIGGVQFRGDRHLLVLRHWPQPVLQLWDVHTGDQVQESPLGLTKRVAWPRGDSAVTADGRLLAGVDRDDDRVARVWPLDGSTAGADGRAFRGHVRRVLSVALSLDGRLLATADGDPVHFQQAAAVKLWDVASGRELRGWSTGAQGAALRLTFGPDGTALASAGVDGTVRVWDVATGAEARVLSGHQGFAADVSFSPDGRRLASAGFSDLAVRVWDAATGQELHTLRGHGHQLTGVSFSPDGRRLASAGYGGEVRLWDPATGQEVLTLRSLTPSERPRETGFTARVAFSPDGRYLAANNWDGSVNVWDGGPPADE
jgi:WD40 repeat protein